MHARTGQNLYGPLTIVRRAIKIIEREIDKNLALFFNDSLQIDFCIFFLFKRKPMVSEYDYQVARPQVY